MSSKTRMKFLYFSVILAGMLSFSSCSYKYLGPESPEIFYSKPCPDETAEKARDHAFSVILNAMNSRNWHISSIDRDEYEVNAKVKGAEWSRVEMKVKSGGIVSIQRKKEGNLSRRDYKFMEKSIEDLKKIYFKKYRCGPKRRNVK